MLVAYLRPFQPILGILRSGVFCLSVWGILYPYNFSGYSPHDSIIWDVACDNGISSNGYIIANPYVATYETVQTEIAIVSYCRLAIRIQFYSFIAYYASRKKSTIGSDHRFPRNFREISNMIKADSWSYGIWIGIKMQSVTL